MPETEVPHYEGLKNKDPAWKKFGKSNPVYAHLPFDKSTEDLINSIGTLMYTAEPFNFSLDKIDIPFCLSKAILKKW